MPFLSDEKERAKDKRLWAKYGITFRHFNEIGRRQNWECAICQIKLDPHPPQKGARDDAACVDHCHQTGKIRGLLCVRCNIGLGYFRDDPELLDAARWYAEQHAHDLSYVGLNS